MFQESEIVTLGVAVIGAFILLFVLSKRRIPQFRFFYIGFFAIVAASFFTVIEGVIWKEFYNFLEHLSYMMAGVSFVAGCRRLYIHADYDEEVR